MSIIFHKTKHHNPTILHSSGQMIYIYPNLDLPDFYSIPKSLPFGDFGRVSVATIWPGLKPSKHHFFGSLQTTCDFLAGGLNQPTWKMCSSKWESCPNRDENKTYLKPPPTTCVIFCPLFLAGYLHLSKQPVQHVWVHHLLWQPGLLFTQRFGRNNLANRWRKKV